MSRLHWRAVKILLILSAYLVYIFPSRGQVSIPTGWLTAIDWGRFYIVHYRSLYRATAAPTFIAELRNYAATDVLPKVHFAMINIVTGTTAFPEDVGLFEFLPWVILLVIPLFAVGWYRRVSRLQGNYAVSDAVFVLLFALFPIASTLQSMTGSTNGSIPARAFFLMLLVLIAIIFVQKENTALTSLTILLLIVFFNYYHTWTYYFVFYMFVFGMYLLLNRELTHATVIVIFSGVVFLIAGFFTNQILLREVIIGLTGITELLDGFSFSSESSPSVDPKYLDRSEGLYTDLVLAHTGLLAAFCLLVVITFAYDYLEKENGPSSVGLIVMVYSFGHGAVAIGLFIWGGIGAVMARLFEGLTVLSTLYPAYILTSDVDYLTLAGRVLIVGMVILSISGYLMAPNSSTLSEEESAGLTFTGDHANETSIYSDFRTGTPMLYHNRTKVETFHSGRMERSELEELLERVYYDVSEPERALDPLTAQDEYYVMLTAEQVESGPREPDYTPYRPAPDDFRDRWRDERSYGLVYDSGEFTLFKRRD